MPTSWRRSAAMMLAAVSVCPPLASALTVINGYTPAADDRFAAGYPTAPVANTSPTFIGNGFDLSGVGWSLADPTHAGALLSPKHVLEADHYTFNNNAAGDPTPTVAFMGAGTSTLVTNYLTTSAAIASTVTIDLNVGTLANALPANVAVYSILDKGTSGTYVGDPLLMYGKGDTGPRVGWNSVIGTLAGNMGNELFFNTAGTQANMGVPESGDSQSPLFIPWTNPVSGQNTLTLIGAEWTTAYSSLLGDASRYQAINALMTPTGYALRWTPAAIGTIWKGGTSNNWGTASNWTAGLPQTTAYIEFDSNQTAQAASRNVNLATDRTVVGIYFKSGPAGRPFTLAAGSTLTLGRGGIVNYDAAAQTINSTLVFGDNQNWFAGSGGLVINGTIINNGNLLYFHTTGNSTLSGLLTGTGALAKDGPGTLAITSSQLFTGGVFAHAGVIDVKYPTGLSSGAITMDPGATIRFSQPSSQAAVINTLTQSAGSTLDINSTAVIPTASAAARDALFSTLKPLVISGRAGGAWNGTGLTSSLAASNNALAGKEVYGLAIIRSSDFWMFYNTTTHPFAGVGVNPWAILMRYTYMGDTDLDGQITLDDYLNLDDGYLLHRTALWTNGDFNYDGTIDFRDFALIDGAYYAQSGALALPEIQLHTAWFGQPYVDALTGLPEPGSLIMLAGGTVMLAGRRGKTRQHKKHP